MRRGLTPQGWLDTSNGRVHYQSGYEKKFMIWLDQHHVKWEKCNERFPYTSPYDSKKHMYNPDFLVYLDKKYYVEVKGAIRRADPFKFRYFPLSLPLVLLGYDELHNELGLNVFDPKSEKVIDKNKWPYKLLASIPDYVELGELDGELKQRLDSKHFMEELKKYDTR